MKIAFLTEMGFESKVPENHTNMRTEFAWMCKLDAMHYNISNYNKVVGYNHIFIIFPKGNINISSVGNQLTNKKSFTSDLLKLPIVRTLKERNDKVYVIQEGPHWLWNEYEVEDQILFYSMVSDSDGIFAHNSTDIPYYRGIFPNLEIKTIPSLMIESLISDTQPVSSPKVLIGGNFARWYGGMESYIVASKFELPIWTVKSHAFRYNEELIENLYHIEWVGWVEWMKEVSKFKYAVHLMPTVAAGTFSLNCGYFGIPTIGNIKVDTQRLLFPDLSIDVDDVAKACELAGRLKSDELFYRYCSETARYNYMKYYHEDVWASHMKKILE